MTTVVIAGCGYVGSALAQNLAAGGDKVFAIRRQAFDEKSAIPGVTAIAADLTQPEMLSARLPASADLVVYSAGADASTPDAYRAAYLQGLQGLLDALRMRAISPARLLFVSSTAVFAQEGGQWVDETSATEPTNFRGRILLKGETLARKAPGQTVVLRLSGIYGPQREGLARSVRDGTANGGQHFTNRIHRDDCAGLIQHLLFLPALAPTYLGVDNEPARKDDVVKWLAAELGVALPNSTGKTGRAHPSNKRCSNGLAVESGYGFQHPSFREGYRSIIKNLKR